MEYEYTITDYKLAVNKAGCPTKKQRLLFLPGHPVFIIENLPPAFAGKLF